MPEVTYANPTTTMDTNTQKVLGILPPIQEPIPQTVAPTPIQRPISDHGSPHTLPPIQEQIHETAQPYTPKPWYDDKPTGTTVGTVNTLMRRPLTPGQENARDEAVAAVAYLLGYGLTGAYDGLTGYASDNTNLLFPRDGLEDSSYELGRNFGDLIKHSITQSREEIKQLIDDPPHFEIPTIKMPKFDRPELPKFEIPKIPEFEIPEIPKFEIPKIPDFNPFPKPTVPEPQQKPQPEPKEKDIPRLKEPAPKPVPSSLERQLRDLELSPCGTISFGISYVTKVTGERWISNSDNTGGYFESITESSSLEQVFGLYQAWRANYYSNIPTDIVSWIESGGGTGVNTSISLGGGVSYTSYQGIGNGVGFDGDPYRNGYPRYYASQSVIRITGLTTKTAINSVLNSLSSGGITPEVYRISFSHPDAKDCPIGKTPPPPPPPPKPPEDCDCAMTCCPEIDYRKIQAIIAEEVKKLDVTAAIPLSWQIRHEGENPQMVIQFAEKKSAASGNKPAKYDSAKYPITVPHWKGGKNDKPSLPPYTKGNWEGILVLKDNSKVTINAQSEAECTKILNAIKPWIKSNMLEDSYFKCGKITTKEPIKQIQVYPRYGRYFGKGQKNNKPDWRVDLP